MSSIQDLNPIPVFPPELELKVFETCFFAYPKILPTLLLICNHVFQSSHVHFCKTFRINAIRYYSALLLRESDVDRMKTWIKSQAPESIHHNVKAILVHLPDVIIFEKCCKIISLCTGVEYLCLWFYVKHPPESFEATLACLPNVRHLALIPMPENDSVHQLGPKRWVKLNRAAFRDTLASIDWGQLPALKFPLDTFPNVSYAAMATPWWHLKVEDMQKMEEWVARSSSKGLILLVYSNDQIFFDNLDNMEAHNPILRNEKVVVVSVPANWIQDWEATVFGDGNDIFAIAKRFVGRAELKDRILWTVARQ
ncbi:hypothetical protein DL96DRAFT_724270 [Flagelloscypha sp. PMI_526]|nr:hypothetical protein DL96DRAFT_724270 [Flagelloscypha sp. PMI_526]